MSAPHGRRGFLRGLVTLPLIGGGVTLIGQPVAAAEPVTEQLLDNYDTWLFLERRYLRHQRFGREFLTGRDPAADDLLVGTIVDGFKSTVMDVVRMNNAAAAYHLNGDASALGRAAVVLSAVGCDWRGHQ